jgi:lipoate-protein ligase B
LNLGTIAYDKGLLLQKKLVDRVKSENCDYLLLQEHTPTITLGKNASEDDLLWDSSQIQAKGIDLVQVQRGGKLTAHIPGQLVGYPLFDLKVHALATRAFVSRIEGALQEAFALFGLEVETRSDRPGLWLGHKKLAALGFRIKDHISSHGFAINVHNDLEIFSGFKPCGFSADSVATMSEFLGKKTPKLDEVAEAVTASIARAFGQNVQKNTEDIGRLLQ